MSGYTPVFDTVFNGTMCGKWPELPVWLTLLPLADWRGHIDMTPEAIAARTGWPLELLVRGIESLCQPDPRSRSKAEEGRRLILIEADRPWGWRVVNIQVYREKSRDRNRVDDGSHAEKMRKWREKKAVTQCDPAIPEVTRGDSTHTQTHTQTQTKTTDSEKKKTKSKTRAPARSRTESTEFPEGFALDDALRQQALARAADCDPDQAFEQFKAHHVTRGSTFKNWRSAWVTWIGNFEQFGYPKRRNGASVPKGMENVKW